MHAVTKVFTSFYSDPETARVDPLKDIIKLLKVKKDERGIELRKSARNKNKDMAVIAPRRGAGNPYSGNLNNKFEFY